MLAKVRRHGHHVDHAMVTVEDDEVPMAAERVSGSLGIVGATIGEKGRVIELEYPGVIRHR